MIKELPRSNIAKTVAFAALPMLLASSALGQVMTPSNSLYGNTGLIDLPTAESQVDAEIHGTYANLPGAGRTTINFQVFPRISGSFRYTRISNWDGVDDSTYDRSFDFQYRLLDERKYSPALAIGLRDFMGTGLYSSEYIVATKNIGSKLKVTAGVGWGRLSGSDDPDDLRDFEGSGGVPLYDQWFSGPSSFFGGVEWQTPIKNLRVKAEYSPDQYTRENVIRGIRTEPTLDRQSDFNFGIDYKTQNGYEFGLYYLYGSELGFKLTTSLNPNRSRGIRDSAPITIAQRKNPASTDTSWTEIPGIRGKAVEELNKYLRRDGMSVESLTFSGTHAELRFRNTKYLAMANALGRASRAMAKVFPDSVEHFTLIPVSSGLSLVAVSIKRSDLEANEFEPNASGNIAGLVDASDAAGAYQPEEGLYPRFSWGITPYVGIQIFDATNPFAIQAGLRLSATYNISPGFSVSGSVTKRVLKDDAPYTPGPSALPRVRTEGQLYNINGDPSIDRLTADYLFKLSPSTYGRISAGYLERMFGGVSAEILWKPTDQKWGLGAEVNYVKKRDYDLGFDFLDYSVVTGHVSAYFELPRRFDLQIDAGRYLAGDYGATISLARTFNNGWRVGAYATLTNVSFEDFGEGSFDKGINFEVPFEWALGKPSRRKISNTLASLSRDGGARLNVSNRLYDTVRESHNSAISDSWARFWK